MRTHCSDRERTLIAISANLVGFGYRKADYTDDIDLLIEECEIIYSAFMTSDFNVNTMSELECLNRYMHHEGWM